MADFCTLSCNIIQWNCQSLRPKTVCLESLLNIYKVHVCILSETWLERNSSFRISGYNTYRLDRSDGYGGVAMLIHRSVKAASYPVVINNSGIEILHVKVYNCQYIENIFSVYCPSSISTSQNDWDDLFSLCNNKTVISGDFNGHHSDWSYKIDQRGKQIYDALLNHDLICINDGSPTRVKMVNGILQESSPDITFISSNLALMFEWKTTNESLGSDHLIIKVTCNTNIAREYTKKRNFKNCNWDSYTGYLESMFNNTVLPSAPQDLYNVFESHMLKAVERHIPYTKIPQNIVNKFSPKPYWSPALSKAVAERRLALANLRRNPSPANLKVLQNKISNAQRLIRRAKCDSWHKFCSSIDQTSSASLMWNKMKWIKGQRSTKVCVDKVGVQNLLSSLTPDFVWPPYPSFRSANNLLEFEISMHELDNCTKKKDTAPGSDDISYSMINHLPPIGKLLLLQIYNKCLTTGFVPSQWRKVNIIPIPKQGNDPSSTSLRPISLISCMCKIFHSILNKRIEWYCERQNLFHANMVGFRKARSCLDSLSKLVSTIQLGFTKNFATVACFIDIDSAYNNVDVSSLLRILDHIGIGSKVCYYLWSYLNQRSIKISCPDGDLVRMTGRGLPQGDPISPLLFNILTMDICKSSPSVEILQYADDFVLYVCNRDVNRAVEVLQSSLHYINPLFKNLGLEISTVKSKICIFKKGSYRGDIFCTIDGSINIPVVKEIKYLGVWLDSSLRWRRHINETTKKVSKYVNLLKVLSGSGWGVHQKHLRKLYISIIRSRIDYASFLYDNSCKTHLLKLDRAQNQALRIIGGFIRSTPIHAMENELGLPPLHIRRKYLAGKFLLRAKSLHSNSTIEAIENLCLHKTASYWSHKKIPLLISVYEHLNGLDIHSSSQLEMYSLETWISNINVAQIICNNIPGITLAKRAYNTEYIKYTCQNFIEQRYSGFYKIFTDGSKDKSIGGAAFLDPQLKKYCKFAIDSNISIMHIELIAIAKALSYIESIGHNKFVILTDSKSSVQHLARYTSHGRGNPVAYQIYESIWNKQKSKTIFIQWIPSHIQLKENDEVDVLAKQAVVDGMPVRITPLYSDHIICIKELCLENWQEYFDARSREKGIWYRTIQPHVCYYPWIDNINLNKSFLTIALRLRSGHIPSNKFGYLMKKVPSPNCITCGVVEDVLHILMECSRNSSLRNLFFEQKPFDVGFCNSILANPSSAEAYLLYKLVSSIL